jgi:phosphoglycerate dehydrogenase-like enzyme
VRDGRLGGAVLDCLSEEPLPPTSPLWSIPNIIVTPHTSWSSGRVLDRSIELFCENLERYRLGRELVNVVDPGLGY